MKNRRPIQTALRSAKKLARITDPQSFCILCGKVEVAYCFVVSNRFLQDHHFLGQNHDPNATVPVCPDCHYFVTENLRRADVTMLFQEDPLDRVEIMLEALAVHHEHLAISARRMAKLLRQSSKTRT